MCILWFISAWDFEDEFLIEIYVKLKTSLYRDWGGSSFDILTLILFALTNKLEIQIIKSPQSGVTLCFQFVSPSAAASAAAASAAATTFVSHVKTVWAKP